MLLKDDGVDATMLLCSSGETQSGTEVMMTVDMVVLVKSV